MRDYGTVYMENSQSRRKQAIDLRENCREIAVLEQAVQAAMQRHEEEGAKGSNRSFECPDDSHD